MTAKQRNVGWAALLLAAGVVLPSAALAAAPAPEATALAQQREARLKWWREAKFGMFIHWGLYSKLAGSYNGKEIDNNGEWIMDRAIIQVAA